MSTESSTAPNTPKPCKSLPSDFYSADDTSTADGSPTHQASHPNWAHLLFPSHWTHLPHLAAGAGPFTTRLVHQTPSGRRVHWESRKHRKRLRQHVEASPHPAHAAKAEQPWYERWLPFKPAHIAWWTAVLFDIGSLCFVFSSICLFIPDIYTVFIRQVGYIGWVSFTGSMFFTIGASVQLCEVLSTPIIARWQELTHRQRQYMRDRAYKGRPGAEPLSAEQQQQLQASGGYKVDHPSPVRANLSSLLFRIDFHVAWIQWIGAVAFSINTFAFSGSFVLTTPEQTGLVDFCDVFASCCFTVSGYLSILECTHRLAPFKPPPLSNSLRSIDWWLTWFNFLGGVGFLLNGILIIYYPDPGQLRPAYPLLIGSVFFQIGSHLQYLEQADTHNTNREEPSGQQQQPQGQAGETQKMSEGERDLENGKANGGGWQNGQAAATNGQHLSGAH